MVSRSNCSDHHSAGRASKKEVSPGSSASLAASHNLDWSASFISWRVDLHFFQCLKVIFFVLPVSFSTGSRNATQFCGWESKYQLWVSFSIDLWWCLASFVSILSSCVMFGSLLLSVAIASSVKKFLVSSLWSVLLALFLIPQAF